MSFIKNILSVLIALILFTIIAVLILFGIIFSSVNDQKEVSVKMNSVLHLNLSGVLKDRTSDNDFDKIPAFFPGVDLQKSNSLSDLIRAVKNAKNDEKIRGIFLEPGFLISGWASVTELRNALLEFKESDKFIYVYDEYMSEKEFYLCSVADSIFINPSGAFEFNGISLQVAFYKGLLEKLELKPNIFRVGKFKGAVEPFMRKNLSKENRSQYNSIITSIHEKELNDISKSIGIPVNELKNIADSMKIQLPEEAVEMNFIQKIGYRDEIVDLIKEKVGIAKDKKLKFLSLKKYNKKLQEERKYSKNKIAVIYAQGEIMMGSKREQDKITGTYFAKQIKKTRLDKNVKAIVLRINSPGGSATASDIIWRELMLAKEKKPLIVSFSDVAASGGYYIAGPADKIYAHPNTITGSIGIFGMFFDFSNFFNNKLGITFDRVNTGNFSDLITAIRPLRADEKSIIQKNVDKGYEDFVSKMASNRGLSIDSLKSIAQGRVWTGIQAKNIGLVDEIGSLDDAIAEAVKVANLGDDYSIKSYPKSLKFYEVLLNNLNSSINVYLYPSQFTPMAQEMKKMMEISGIQARLLGDVTIE